MRDLCHSEVKEIQNECLFEEDTENLQCRYVYINYFFVDYEFMWHSTKIILPFLSP